MFLDASAIIAILARASEAGSLAARLDQAARVFTSPIAVFEATLGLARLLNIAIAAAKSAIDRFLQEAEAETVTIDAAIAEAAVAAFDRFGRGRHRAALNMGGCFAYACARSLEVPLLFKGDDFPHTDIAVA